MEKENQTIESLLSENAALKTALEKEKEDARLYREWYVREKGIKDSVIGAMESILKLVKK